MSSVAKWDFDYDTITIQGHILAPVSTVQRGLMLELAN